MMLTIIPQQPQILITTDGDYATVSGHIGVRLRTHCRIRHGPNATAFVRAAMLTFAPCKGEIHKVQIEDLCDGYISLSNAEGL